MDLTALFLTIATIACFASVPLFALVLHSANNWHKAQ